MNESVGRVLRQFATGLPGSEEKQFSTRLDALKTALTKLEPSRT